MVHWNDISVIRTDSLVLTKLAHALIGAFLWEWSTTCHFEWQFYTGRRPWRLSTTVYLLCRYLALYAVVCNLIVLSATPSMNCTVLVRMLMCSACMSTNCGTTLIALRALALWRKNIFLIVALVALLLTNLTSQIIDFTLLSSEYESSTSGCIPTENTGLRLQVFVALGTDMSLLILILVGLYCQCQPSSLWKILFSQGLLWIALAAIVYVPLAVFMCLNLNGVMNDIFLNLSYITLDTCAMRMHRGLVEHADSVPSVSISIVSSVQFRPGESVATQSSGIPGGNVALTLGHTPTGL
ncbi:hypothetical protein OBBRIDRAFT_660905 [Obba rivulosa]|uniref:Uncharacterized protein n=1 Tax=Obba rivulosa TaxID=1052685 RepID=A0A8E2AUL1_9APHY|nr:hypothetical protein OBBRIDRAFT_660905 [Obba rivulosa]